MIEKRLTQTQNDFSTIKTTFQRSEDAAKASRHSNEVLQEEYCKLVTTVNDERRKNRALIDDTLLKVRTDLELFQKKVDQVDIVRHELFTRLDTHINVSTGQQQYQHSLLNSLELKLQDVSSKYSEFQKEIEMEVSEVK